MLNLKGVAFVVAVMVLTGGLSIAAGVFGVNGIAAESRQDAAVTATAATGAWTSTCSGGLQSEACDEGVLEVTFADASRALIPWAVDAKIPPSITVESRDGQSWFASGTFASETEPVALVAALALFLGVVASLLAGVFAYLFVGSWGTRRDRYAYA